MGERSEVVQQEAEAELDSIAARLCTALTTLHEYPLIRYRVGKPPEAGDAPGAGARSMLAQRLAQKVGSKWEGAGTFWWFWWFWWLSECVAGSRSRTSTGCSAWSVLLHPPTANAHIP